MIYVLVALVCVLAVLCIILRVVYGRLKKRDEEYKALEKELAASRDALRLARQWQQEKEKLAKEEKKIEKDIQNADSDSDVKHIIDDIVARNNKLSDDRKASAASADAGKDRAAGAGKP